MEFIRRKPETTDSAAALIFRLGDPHLLDGAENAVVVAEGGRMGGGECGGRREQGMSIAYVTRTICISDPFCSDQNIR